MKKLYLVLAILGALLPWWFFYQFLAVEGFDLAKLIAFLFSNGPAAGFTLDVVISSLAFWAFIFSRARQGGPSPYLLVALNLVFGLSCALPAYLYASEGRAKRQ